jgi:hypothetical protein
VTSALVRLRVPLGAGGGDGPFCFCFASLSSPYHSRRCPFIDRRPVGSRDAPRLPLPGVPYPSQGHDNGGEGEHSDDTVCRLGPGILHPLARSAGPPC